LVTSVSDLPYLLHRGAQFRYVNRRVGTGYSSSGSGGVVDVNDLDVFEGTNDRSILGCVNGDVQGVGAARPARRLRSGGGSSAGCVDSNSVEHVIAGGAGFTSTPVVRVTDTLATTEAAAVDTSARAAASEAASVTPVR
jgi:hypothetical protein